MDAHNIITVNGNISEEKHAKNYINVFRMRGSAQASTLCWSMGRAASPVKEMNGHGPG